MSDPSAKWFHLSAALRAQRTQVDPDSLQPPLGFSTRVVARARTDARADATGLALWRRWSLAGAAASMLACSALFAIRPDHPAQIIPVPALDEFAPLLPPQP